MEILRKVVIEGQARLASKASPNDMVKLTRCAACGGRVEGDWMCEGDMNHRNLNGKENRCPSWMERKPARSEGPDGRQLRAEALGRGYPLGKA